MSRYHARCLFITTKQKPLYPDPLRGNKPAGAVPITIGMQSVPLQKYYITDNRYTPRFAWRARVTARPPPRWASWGWSWCVGVCRPPPPPPPPPPPRRVGSPPRAPPRADPPVSAALPGGGSPAAPSPPALPCSSGFSDLQSVPLQNINSKTIEMHNFRHGLHIHASSGTRLARICNPCHNKINSFTKHEISPLARICNQGIRSVKFFTA